MCALKLNTKQFKAKQALHKLTAAELHKTVADLIITHCELLAAGDECSPQVVSDVVLEASVTGQAIEGTCNDLAAMPTGHTIRNYLNEFLAPEALDQLESQVNAALTGDLPKRLWQGPQDWAVDFHDEPFYGKSPALLRFACRGEAKAGTTYFFRTATLYHIHDGIPTTLALTFVLPSDTTLAVLQRLLERAPKLGLRHRCLYLDKGFCTIPVIRYLQQARTPAILACPLRGKQGGTRALCRGRTSYTTSHTFASAENGECTATMTMVRTFDTSRRRQRRRKARWLAYVLIEVALPPPPVRQRYRRRFGIESSYRCMRSTHAKTTSRNAAVHFFLIALAFIPSQAQGKLWSTCGSSCAGGGVRCPGAGDGT